MCGCSLCDDVGVAWVMVWVWGMVNAVLTPSCNGTYSTVCIIQEQSITRDS